ncbi:MAG: Gfo/Idh/MocA family oxidoreductase [Saprospiraceae bacterium]
MGRKIRMGMIGGGLGAFIGDVHRMASRLDGKIDLVCGAFSSDPEKSKKSGKAFYIDPSRVYGNFKEMIEEESKLPREVRMDFVSIVTPNHMHFEPAKLAIEAGFHVVCDKPVTFSLDEAKELKKLVKKHKTIFALTHNYTGYPMVKEARDMIERGKLGKIRRVVVEYPQGWLATRVEESGQKQASWRTDPGKSGKAGCMGDIGTHAENLAEYVTGLKIKKLCADLNTFVPGRKLDDDGAVLLDLEKGAKGILFATQIAAGEENNLRLRVYGEKGGLDWSQMEPNTLIVRWIDKNTEIKRTGVGKLSKAAQAATRIPPGHPEGFIEAFANIYKNFADSLLAVEKGKKPSDVEWDFPKIEDGIRGMEFIDRVVESASSEQKWIKF